MRIKYRLVIRQSKVKIKTYSIQIVQRQSEIGTTKELQVLSGGK